MIRFLFQLPVRLFRGTWHALARSLQNVITALVQIGANKGRSLLTTLGIIIAVTSTITVVAFVKGFGDHMTGMLRGYGTQYMVVRPWAPVVRHGVRMNPARLDIHDVNALRLECPSLRRISPFVYANNAEVVFGQSRATDIPVRGVNEQYQTIRNYFVDVGRFIGPIDVETGARVIVLGRTLLTLLEADESIVGQHVLVHGNRFLVVGLLAAKGSMMGDDQDKTVMIPHTTALNLFPYLRESIPVLVEAESEAMIPRAEGEIIRVLRRRHGLQPGQPNDFRIERQDQMLREFDQVRNVASAILAGIVSISLLVGGIGIMNMMLVSVTERTREIGLRKSIGARRRDILMQFLTEAVVLCTVGGMVGVVMGYVITYVASLHPRMVDVSVPWWSVLLALGFSAGTGMLFGMLPACKAALMHPIDALRHE